jgi:ribosomal protein S27AE
MKELYAVSKYKKLLGMRWLILNAEKKNIDILGSIKEKKCPICGHKFKNVFFLQRHLDTTYCGALLEKTLRE